MIPVRADREKSIKSAMGNKLIVVGVTGHPASGKDTVADYLVRLGFSKFSCGDILRKEMKKLGIPTDRSHIHEFVKEMRVQRGNGYLAEEIIKNIKGNTVISGIRNRGELDAFKKKFDNNFKLITVQTPIEIRYKRAKNRNGIRDNISFDQFKAEEEKEKNTESGSHEVDLVIKEADAVIENGETPETLFLKIDKFIESMRNIIEN